MQNPNEAKVVRFTNIFDFDYTHAYGGVPYQLRAGVTMLLPWAIGDHLATHLARQAIIRKAPMRDENAVDGRGGESTRSDRPLWDDTAIDALKAKIVQEAYVEERVAPVSEAEMYQRKVEELNKQFPGIADTVVAPVKEPSADVVAGITVPPPNASPYVDKSDVVNELTKRGIKFDARLGKDKLEKLLQ